MKENKVVTLIGTLSKAEKKNFTQFAQKKESQEFLFLELFRLYDKYGNLSDEEVLEKIPKLKKEQIHNVRSHLYTQILRSLRKMHLNKSVEIEIREKIDFASVLNSKGFFSEALDMLNKVKKVALQQNRNVLALEILFFERSIELQNITKSIKNRAVELVEETNELVTTIDQIKQFSTIDLELYSYYLKHGFCTSKDQFDAFENEFAHIHSLRPNQGDNFYCFLYYYQSLSWYHYIRQEFKEFQDYSRQWVQLFEENEQMKSLRPSLYLKSIHNVITGSFLVADFEHFTTYFELLQAIDSSSLMRNELSMKTLYEHMHYLDYAFFTGQFSQYHAQEELLNLLNNNPYHWDNHRLAVFYYKLGCLHFGLRDYQQAADSFLLVGQHFTNTSDSPIYIFSKILLALAHLQLGNYRLVQSQTKALQNQLSKMKEGKELEKHLVRLISRLLSAPINEQELIYKKTLVELEHFKQQEYVNIAFLHFFAIEWIQGQIENRDACTIIEESFQKLQSKSGNFALHE